MDLFPTVEAPILGNLVPVLDARAEDELCDPSDRIDVFLYSFGVTSRNL